MIPRVDLTSNRRGWKSIPAYAGSGDGQGLTVWGNRWEEKPYVTIDFLLLLLPFSILPGNIPTVAQHTKVTTKDSLRVTTHAKLAFVTPPHNSHPKTTFQRNPPSPSLRVPV